MEEKMFYCDNLKYEIVAETASDTLSYEDKPMLISNLTLPKMRTLGARVEYLKFNAFYSDLASRLRNRARLEMYPAAVEDYEHRAEAGGEFHPHTLTATFNTGLLSKCLASVKVVIESYEGGANGFTEQSAQTWMVNKGVMLKARDLFKPVCNWRDQIFSQIRRQAAKMAEEGVLFEDWENLIVQYLDWENFYLTNTDFVVFYPLFTIAPHASGIVEFKIPLSRLRYCIRNEMMCCPPDCSYNDCDDFCPPVPCPPLTR